MTFEEFWEILTRAEESGYTDIGRLASISAIELNHIIPEGEYASQSVVYWLCEYDAGRKILVRNPRLIRLIDSHAFNSLITPNNDNDHGLSAAYHFVLDYEFTELSIANQNYLLGLIRPETLNNIAINKGDQSDISLACGLAEWYPELYSRTNFRLLSLISKEALNHISGHQNITGVSAAYAFARKNPALLNHNNCRLLKLIDQQTLNYLIPEDSVGGMPGSLAECLLSSNMGIKMLAADNWRLLKMIDLENFVQAYGRCEEFLSGIFIKLPLVLGSFFNDHPNPAALLGVVIPTINKFRRDSNQEIAVIAYKALLKKILDIEFYQKDLPDEVAVKFLARTSSIDVTRILFEELTPNIESLIMLANSMVVDIDSNNVENIFFFLQSLNANIGLNPEYAKQLEDIFVKFYSHPCANNHRENTLACNPVISDSTPSSALTPMLNGLKRILEEVAKRREASSFNTEPTKAQDQDQDKRLKLL